MLVLTYDRVLIKVEMEQKLKQKFLNHTFNPEELAKKKLDFFLSNIDDKNEVLQIKHTIIFHSNKATVTTSETKNLTYSWKIPPFQIDELAEMQIGSIASINASTTNIYTFRLQNPMWFPVLRGSPQELVLSRDQCIQLRENCCCSFLASACPEHSQARFRRITHCPGLPASLHILFIVL